MTANELRQKFLEFMKSKGHVIIPSASLVPENDSSTLFISAGMQPMVPYLLGEKHPGGKMIANVQKCIRTGDIDEVGDNRHLTFFEMMGNWSLGDYFKKESISWSWEFLTKPEWLGLDPKRFYVTVFKGEDGIPRDEEAIKIWQEVFKKDGIKAEVAGEDEMIKSDVRIIPMGVDDNFWIAGTTGPCGGDTEIFYDVKPEQGKLEGNFSELVGNFRIMEVWNNVFMEFNKKEKDEYKEEISKLQLENKDIPKEYYEYEKLVQRNVDTGMGVERILAVLQGKDSVFETELFEPIFKKIEELSGKKYKGNEKLFRIVADHIKASVFLLSDGVEPSNKDRGYVLRRLIRKVVAIFYIYDKNIDSKKIKSIAQVVFNIYKDAYYQIFKQEDELLNKLSNEIRKFRATIENGFKELDKLELKIKNGNKDEWNYIIVGKVAFDFYQTYGFPIEIFIEELEKRDIPYLDNKEKSIKEFQEELKKHQELSRTASAGKFKGGLADASVETTKLHTAAHLLLAALREVLGGEVFQKGANITAERLRFDFNYPQKLTPEQIKKVEDLVNQKIQEKIEVQMMEMPKDEALKVAKTSFDPAKYGDTVKVYKINDFSSELCGGPHVKNTGELGHFKIAKEESSSAGVRRIKAVLE